MTKCLKPFDYFLLRSRRLPFMDFCPLFGFLTIGNALVICFAAMAEYLSFVVVRTNRRYQFSNFQVVLRYYVISGLQVFIKIYLDIS